MNSIRFKKLINILFCSLFIALINVVLFAHVVWRKRKDLMLLKHEFAKALGRMCVLCQTAGQSVSLWLTVWLTVVKWMVGHRRLINRDLSAAPFRGRHSGSSASISPNPLPPPLHVFFYIYRSPLPLLLPGSSISRPMSKSHYDSSVLITITVNNCGSAATLWLSRLKPNKWFNSSLLPGVEINTKHLKIQVTTLEKVCCVLVN